MQALDQYVDALRTQNWGSLAGCLAEDVHRTGPYLDEVRGREAYVAFLARVIPAMKNYELVVHRVRKLDDETALVELSEILDLEGVRTECPEAILFGFDGQGLIRRVDIYIKQPPMPGAAAGGFVAGSRADR